MSEPFFPKTCPWKVALVCSVLILLVLLGGISLGIWKEHQVKRREIKKWSKEHEEMLLLKKGTKSVLKIRGICGNSSISQGSVERLGIGGAREARDAGVPQRTSFAGDQRTKERNIRSLKCGLKPQPVPSHLDHHSPMLCPRPLSTPPLCPHTPSFPAPTLLLQRVLPVLWHRVLLLRISQEQV